MLTDDAPTDPGESYYVANGGMVFLAATPAGASGLEYQDGSTGTIALADPGATITADLFYVAGGDVLELPGTTVKNVTFGTSSLSVTTDAGSYDFTNVDYFPSPLAGYTSAVDPRTGLVAITFVAGNVFTDMAPAASAPTSGAYLWSDSRNWSAGLPAAGSDAVMADSGTFDVAAGLSVNSLWVVNGAGLTVEDNLTVATLSAETLSVTAGTLAVGGTLGLGQGISNPGNVSVSGGGVLESGPIIVGDGGLGSLAITAGGTRRHRCRRRRSPTSPAPPAPRSTSPAPTPTGRSPARCIVGNADEGLLNIAAGATVTAATLDAGAQSSGAGIVSISGDNSSLITAGSLAIGDAGSGEFSVLGAANVSIGGDLDLDSSGGSANIDLENAAGTVFIGGNLNVGLAGAAVLTVGPGTTVELDNGGINAGANFVLNLYTGIDPLYSDGGTDNVKSTQTQSYPAYVAATAFDLTQGVTYTLDTPTIYGASGFTIGSGSSDTLATELILNADTFSADFGDHVRRHDRHAGGGDRPVGDDRRAAERDERVLQAGEPEPGAAADRRVRRRDRRLRGARHDRGGHQGGGDVQPERLGGGGDRQQRPRWGC